MFSFTRRLSSVRFIASKTLQGLIQKKNINKIEINNLNILTRGIMTEAKRLKTDTISTIGTHCDTFHCDEVLACYMLLQLDNMKDAKIVRSRNPEVLKTCDIVVDVGQKFDEKNLLFDHHQKGFNETFSSLRPEFGDKYNIRLSSAGLVYVYFGEPVLKSILKKNNIELTEDQLKVVYEQIYKSFIMEIDAIDNGVPICEGEQKYFISTHISARVGHFNAKWNETEEIDEFTRFQKAQRLVGEEFTEKVLFCVNTWLPAREIVKKAILDSKSVHPSGEIIELGRFCPWKDHLFALEEELNLKGLHKYVLFSGKTDDFRVMGVPISPGSFEGRKFLHKDWRGVSNVAEVSGIKDAVFCHATGFIGGAKSRDASLEMAVKSLEHIEN